MTIISLVRGTQNDDDFPETFTLGESPVPDGPVIKEIKFYETGAFGGKAYRGGCYVITFEDSSVKRVIPSLCVVDIAVETAKPEEAVEVVPALPEED